MVDDFSDQDILVYLERISSENSTSFLQSVYNNPSFDGSNLAELMTEEILSKEEAVKVLVELGKLLLDRQSKQQNEYDEILHEKEGMISYLQNQISVVEQQLFDTKNKADELAEKNTIMFQNLSVLEDELGTKNQQLNSLSRSSSIAEIDSQTELTKTQQKFGQITKENAMLEQNNRLLQKEISSLNQQILTLNQQVKDLNLKMDLDSLKMKGLNRDKEKLTSKTAELQQQIDKLKVETDEQIKVQSLELNKLRKTLVEHDLGGKVMTNLHEKIQHRSSELNSKMLTQIRRQSNQIKSNFFIPQPAATKEVSESDSEESKTNQQEELKFQLEKYQKENDELAQQIRDHKAQLEEANQQIQGFVKKEKMLNFKINKLQTQIEGDKKVPQTSQSNGSSNGNDQEEIRKLVEQLQQKEIELQNSYRDLEQIRKEITTLGEFISAEEKSFMSNLAAKDQEIQDLKNQLIPNMNGHHKNQQEAQNELQQQIQKKDEIILDLQKAVTQISELYEEQTQLVQNGQDEKQLLQENLDLQAAVTELQKTYDQLNLKYQELEKGYSLLKEQLDKSQSETESLRQQADESLKTNQDRLIQLQSEADDAMQRIQDEFKEISQKENLQMEQLKNELETLKKLHQDELFQKNRDQLALQQQLTVTVDQSSKKLSQKQSECEELSLLVADTKLNIQSLEEENEELQNQINGLFQTISEMQTMIEQRPSSEKLDEVTLAHNNLKVEYANLQKLYQELQIQTDNDLKLITTLRQDAEKLDMEKNQILNAKSQLEDELNFSLKELESNKQDIIQQKLKITELELNVKNLTDQNQLYEQNIENSRLEFENQLRLYKESMIELEEQFKQLQSQSDDQISHLRLDNQKLNDQLGFLQQEIFKKDQIIQDQLNKELLMQQQISSLNFNFEESSKNIEGQLGLNAEEIQSFKERLEQCESQNIDLKVKLDEATITILKLESDVRKKQTQLVDKQHELEKINQALDNTSSLLETEIRVNKQTKTALEETKQKKDSLQNQLEQYRKDDYKQNQEIETLVISLRETIQSQLEIINSKDNLVNDLNQRIQDQLEQINKQKNQINLDQQTLEALQLKQQELSEQYQQQLKEQQSLIQQYLLSMGQLEEQLDSFKLNQNQLEQEKVKLDEKIEILIKEKSNLQTELNDIQQQSQQGLIDKEQSIQKLESQQDELVQFYMQKNILKEQECEILDRQLVESKWELQSKNDEISKLNDQILNLTQENENTQILAQQKKNISELDFQRMLTEESERYKSQIQLVRQDAMSKEEQLGSLLQSSQQDRIKIDSQELLIAELQSQNSKYMKELEISTMNNKEKEERIQTQVQEIHSLDERLSELQSEKTKVASRVQELEKKINDLMSLLEIATKNYQTLEIENQQLKKVVEYSSINIETRGKLLESQLFDFQQQNTILGQQLNENQKLVNSLSEEVYQKSQIIKKYRGEDLRKTQLISQTSEFIQDLQRKELECQIILVNASTEISKQKNEIDLKEKEIQRLKDYQNEIESKINIYIDESIKVKMIKEGLESYISYLQGKLNHFEEENLLLSKKTEAEVLQRTKIEKEMAEKIQQLQTRNNTLETQVLQFYNDIILMEEKIKKFKESRQLEAKQKQQESNNNLLNKQDALIDELKMNLSQQSETIDDLKLQLRTNNEKFDLLEAQYKSQLLELNLQLESVQQETKDQKAKIIDLENHIKLIEEDLNQRQIAFSDLEEQNKSQVETLMLNVDQQKNGMDLLLVDNQAKINEIRQLNETNQTLRNQISRLESLSNEQTEEINQHNITIKKQEDEMEKLRTLVKNMQAQMDESGFFELQRTRTMSQSVKPRRDPYEVISNFMGRNILL